MYEAASPAVIRAIESATENNQAGQSPTVINLFLALIADDEGRPAQLLYEHGLQRSESLQSISQIDDSHIDIGNLLSHARCLARPFTGEAITTSEFFTLALIDKSPPLCQQLCRHGLDFEQFRHAVTGGKPSIIPSDDPLQFDEISERMLACRVIDVNANRARESLRVLDDYCRFVINDRLITEESKSLRHDLVTCLEQIPDQALFAARNTLMDVGTTISLPTEMYRQSPRDVALINMKRLQESLRSIEEYGKLLDTRLAAQMETLRYRAYTIEKAVANLAEARQRLGNAQLYLLLTASQCQASLDWTIAEAAAGGVSIIQLREKNMDDKALLERARAVRRWTRQHHLLFIMNDRPDLARLAEADGVHLGQSDLSVHDARQILGQDALIGVSTHNLEQVRDAVLHGASYLGVGPTFPSTTKQFDDFPGIEFVHQALNATTLPVFAIGGINRSTLPELLTTGCTRVAVASAIAAAENPRLEACHLAQSLQKSQVRP